MGQYSSKQCSFTQERKKTTRSTPSKQEQLIMTQFIFFQPLPETLKMGPKSLKPVWTWKAQQRSCKVYIIEIKQHLRKCQGRFCQGRKDHFPERYVLKLLYLSMIMSTYLIISNSIGQLVKKQTTFSLTFPFTAATTKFNQDHKPA